MNSEGCVTAIVTVIVFAAILLFGGFSCWNKYVHGNKQFIDLKQDFRVAYVQTDRTKPAVRVTIAKWNDYENSDSVQIVTTDGKVYYTHLANVVLCNQD